MTERRFDTYLRVDTNDFVALFAAIGEHVLVALDAVRMLVPEHVALPGQRLVALPATEVAAVPVLVHRLRVLATENQLQRKMRRVLENVNIATSISFFLFLIYKLI